MKTLLGIFILGLISVVSAATPPELVTPGKVLASPALTAPLGKEWSVAKGTWTPADGVLTANQIPAQKHPAVLRLATDASPMIVECEFRLNAAKAFTVGCNSAQGHVGRVAITPAKVVIAENSKVNGKVTNHVLAQQVVSLKPSEWQHLKVEYAGDTMAAWLNDTSLTGENPFLATPKTMWFFAAADGIQLRNIHITQGTAASAAAAKP